MDQISSMDVRFYPAAAGSALPGDPSNLDFAQCLGYYNYNKVIISAGVNSQSGVGAPSGGRLRTGGCAEPGAGAPAALRGAEGCPAPESCGRRGQAAPPAAAAVGLAPGNLPPGRCSRGSEGRERQTAGKSSGRRSCSPWPANKGASRARSVRGGVGTCRTFPGRERLRLPARRAQPGGLGRPCEERTEPPPALFSRLSPALSWPVPNYRIIQTGGLSKSASAAGTGGGLTLRFGEGCHRSCSTTSVYSHLCGMCGVWSKRYSQKQ